MRATRIHAVLRIASLVLAGCAAPADAPRAVPRSAPAPATARVEVEAADPALSITAAELRALVESLASDEARGRDTGTPDSLAAAERIAQVLQSAGVQPAGDAGGYLQTIDSQGFRLAEVPRLTCIAPDGTETEAVHGADFSYQRGPPVSGRFDVVIVRQAADIPRPALPDAALLLLTDRRNGQAWLEQAGAPGGTGWGLVLGSGPSTVGVPDETPPQGLLAVEDGTDVARGPLRLRLRGPLLNQATEVGLAAVRVELGAAEFTPAVNVVGVLHGVGTPAHPELAQQAIVLTAHYDHMGVAASERDARRPPGAATDDAQTAAPDLIYNGADDDASGVAFVLELAQAFARGAPPARTLVFLLVTGEEIGLLGTTYYLDHPVVPLDQTVANINFEMVGRPDALVGGAGRLWLTGYELTTLGPAWTAAGLPIAADGRPEQHFYERSDNIAFVQRNVLGQSLSSYDMHDEYHTVADEPDTLDYAHMEAAARAAFAACRMLADGTLQPNWTAPDAPAAPEMPAASPRG